MRCLGGINIVETVGLSPFCARARFEFTKEMDRSTDLEEGEQSRSLPFAIDGQNLRSLKNDEATR